MLLLVLGGVIVLSATDHAYAQSYTGVLTLDSIPSHVSLGETIEFSGRLVTASGQPVQGATIHIKDDVTFGFDQSIGTLSTNNDGYFLGTWAAETRSSGAWDFYAVFEGSSYVSKDRSRTYSVSVGNSYGPASTSIQLDRLPSSVYAGDTVTFTGKLVSNDSPLQNALVGIYEDDPLSPDQFLGSGWTDSYGRFSIDWRVGAGLLETDFDIYAEFQGSSKYKKSQTYRHEVSVYKYGGSITLDSIPVSARIGETVTFSGRLSIDQHSPEGAVVYIKDEDTFNPDDLLVTSYVGSDGKFSATWIVSDVDEDAIADIYAVFEGGSTLGRLTTCDSGVTFDFGGLCRDTSPLRILPPASSPPVPPAPASGAYMNLYYSLNPPRSPHVVIVPSPDSYDKVRGHIIPVREGIQMWSKLLEEKYGGNWDVKIDVLHEKGAFFDSKPDIIMNLVNHDDHQECFFEYLGVAYGVATPYPKLPIQTYVCSTSQGMKLSGADVSATAGHEFIHAMGLGHTFNKPGDLMCSVEDGVQTCPYSSYESSTPSALNLEAIRKIYGSDGFSTPNNNVKFLSKFWLGNSQTDDEQERTLIGTKPPIFSYNQITVQTDKKSYTAGETIRVSGTVEEYTPQSHVISKIASPTGNIISIEYTPTVGGWFSFDLSSEGPLWQDGTYTISTKHIGDERGYAETTFQYVDITPTRPYGSQIADFNIRVAGSDPITYFIDGGRVLDVEPDPPGVLIIYVEFWTDGYVQLTIPRTLLDAYNEDFFVLVDDSEAEFVELLSTATHRTLLIELLAGSERVEIIGTSLWSR